MIIFVYNLKPIIMGKYINVINGKHIGSSFKSKVESLKEVGAIEVDPKDGFQKHLVCVVNNGYFAAAAYCYDEREFEDFNSPKDGRPKCWLVLANAESYIDQD